MVVPGNTGSSISPAAEGRPRRVSAALNLAANISPPLPTLRKFVSQTEARMACFSYIKGWHNPLRLHSALGYRSPLAFEKEHTQPATTNP